MKKNRAERDVMRELRLVFVHTPGLFAIRMNAGSLRGAAGYPIRFGHPGIADYYVRVRSGSNGPWRTLWVEAKSPGSKQSKEQVDFQGLVESFGDRYVVATCAEDVLPAISELQMWWGAKEA